MKKNRILLLKKQYSNGDVVYTLPGGTQEPGEALDQALIREVREEINANVKSLGMAYVYEHSRPSRENSQITKYKIEFAFVCQLVGAYQPQNGSHPDPHQVAVEWISLDQLNQLKLYPKQLKEVIFKSQSSKLDAYLGQFDFQNFY